MSSIPIESLKFTETRSRLSSLVDRVFQRKLRVRIYKGSVPVAAIVSIKDLEDLENYERRRDQAFIAMGKFAEGFRDVSPEEFERQLEIAKAEVRAEMWPDYVPAGMS